MSKQPCVACGRQLAESELLFSARGMICASCEAEIEERSQRSRNVWVTILTGPFAVISGTLTLCVPLLGGVISLLLAVIGLWQGTVAIQAFLSMKDDPDADGTHKALLLVSGVLTLLWALVLFLLVAIALVVTLAATMG